MPAKLGEHAAQAVHLENFRRARGQIEESWRANALTPSRVRSLSDRTKDGEVVFCDGQPLDLGFSVRLEGGAWPSLRHGVDAGEQAERARRNQQAPHGGPSSV